MAENLSIKVICTPFIILTRFHRDKQILKNVGKLRKLKSQYTICLINSRIGILLLHS